MPDRQAVDFRSVCWVAVGWFLGAEPLCALTTKGSVSVRQQEKRVVEPFWGREVKGT